MYCAWIESLFIMTLLSISGFAQPANYAELYPKECRETLYAFARYESRFAEAGEPAGLSGEFVFAIVAPEISQFSYLGNKLQTYSLKVMYVQYGKHYANFSVGLLQMQPAFIEQLDDSIRTNGYLEAQFSDYLIDRPTDREKRVEIVNRLNDTEWQIRYLSVFCTLIHKRFAHMQFADETEKLRFYAVAYNAGLHRTEADLRQIGEKAQFPHFSRHKFKYADVATWFWHTITQENR
ncbi:MAG: hypothetical protein LBF17_02800 [Mediterranea sp.]|jgi:hypothetical protein|nr:hypothetical protein [Mediterranea sp.]